MADLLVANLLIFIRTLRASGIVVRQSGVADAVRALTIVGLRRRQDVRDALRAVLLLRHDDLARFDQLFERFWRPRAKSSDPKGPVPMQLPARARSSVRVLAPGLGAAGAGSDETPESEERPPVARATYSADEIWRRRDFAALTGEETAKAEAAVAQLHWHPGWRRTRRWRAGDGRAMDWRRLLRANARHGAEPFVLPWRRRTEAPRPLVLICDVSGSMEPYTRMLLLFAHALSKKTGRVELFVFSTRLTRVTHQFSTTAAQTAISRVRDAVRDWSGGTRIGQSIHTFNVQWARRVLRHQPVVLLVSDGWDLGEPALLANEMARLQRSVHRLIWLNPLIGSQDYAPLTRGLQAALPFVDDFLSARNVASIEALAEHLESLETKGGAGRGTRVRPSRRRQTKEQAQPWLELAQLDSLSG